jgi:uncharacterized protein (DUF2252 family)
MLASAFTFYRGAAAIMAGDLATTPASGLTVQLCGDAHLSNFGIFAAPDRGLVFDVNDFDETLPGPFEWDVKRLAASISVAGRDRGFDAHDRRAAVAAAAAGYRQAMRRFASMRDLDVWYLRSDVGEALGKLRGQLSAKRSKDAEKGVEKARHKDHLRALDRLAATVDGELRIVRDPPLIVPIEDLVQDGRDIETELRALIGEYRKTLPSDTRHLAERYRYVHAAHKVVGVGSVGARAWIVLLVGRDSDDPLFLQVKEAQRSVLEPYAAKSAYANQGRRVVEGQRLMQAAGDILLGWLRVDGLDGVRRDFYVRQLWDGKRSLEVERMDAGELAIYGDLCGWTLARAHARSGDRAAIAGYLGGGGAFDRAVTEFAERYADQNERDFEEMLAAVEDGRISVDTAA